MANNIHPTAVVAGDAQLGDNITIEPYAVIDGGVTIGDGCHIHSGARLFRGASLGKNVSVFPSAVVGAVPQDLKFGGESSYLTVGDNTIIREFVSLHRGTGEGGLTRIGSDCMIMAYSHVAHDCIIGDKVILANSVNLAGHVEVEDQAILGGIVPVHQFVRIGKHAMVGGGFRVPKDVPPFILAGGYPLSYAGLNAIGLRRRGFSQEAMDEIKDAYRVIFSSRKTVSDAIDELSSRSTIGEEVKQIIDFVKASKRGLLPGPGTTQSKVEL